MPEKPLIFISCGQASPEEIELGKAIETLIRAETPYDAYFAEQQNTLDGLVANILSALERAAALVAVMHHRGTITTPKGTSITRGSPWVEQEVAIAAFIQHVLKRRIEVALYLQRGITREGIRSQLRLAPIEFDTTDEVLQDLRTRIRTWDLSSPLPRALVPEWRFKLLPGYTGERHVYSFIVELVNNGPAIVTDWRAELIFPSEYLENVDRSEAFHTITTSDRDFSSEAGRIFPGGRLQVFSIRYVVTHSNWPDDPGWPGRPHIAPSVKVRVFAGNSPPIEEEISMRQLNNF